LLLIDIQSVEYQDDTLTQTKYFVGKIGQEGIIYLADQGMVNDRLDKSANNSFKFLKESGV